MVRIKYTKSNVASRPTYRTEKFGNLLSDTWQAEIYQMPEGDWSAWVMNLSNNSHTEFKVGLTSRAAAKRWASKKLREKGV